MEGITFAAVQGGTDVVVWHGEVTGVDKIANGFLLDLGKQGGPVYGWFWLIHFDGWVGG